jgi:polysaccharide biosynthesis/export protein
MPGQMQAQFVVSDVNMRMRAILVAALSLGLSACAEEWEQNGPAAEPGGAGLMANKELAEGPGAVSSITTLPTQNRRGPVPPYAAKGEAAAYEYSVGYRIGAGDRLNVRVAGEAELTGEFIVDPSGMISLPYVQQLSVAGKTTRDIEAQIRGRLVAGYLRDPQVSVQIASLRPFYILGEVNGSGSFPYQAGITVQNAIAIAGGYAPRADKREVLLTRRNIKGTDTYRVPVTTQVYPGDVIYVRERWF